MAGIPDEFLRPTVDEKYKQWFDDWEITLGRPRDSASYYFIVVRLPHAEQPEVVFSSSDNIQAACMANLLDKLLSELTGEIGPKKRIMKIEKSDGPDTPRPN